MLTWRVEEGDYKSAPATNEHLTTLPPSCPCPVARRGRSRAAWCRQFLFFSLLLLPFFVYVLSQ